MYLQLKILDPKKYHWPSVDFRAVSPPLGHLSGVAGAPTQQVGDTFLRESAWVSDKCERLGR